MHKIKFLYAIAYLLTFNSAFALSLSIPKSLIDLAVVKKFPKEKLTVVLDQPSTKFSKERQKIEFCGIWTIKVAQRSGNFCIDTQPVWNKTKGDIEMSKVNILKLATSDGKELSSTVIHVLNSSLLTMLDGTSVYHVPDMVGKNLDSIEVQENSFKAAYRQIGQIELGKIQYYHFNFDRDKARYKIDSLQCRCGTKFKIKDFDKVTMVENNVTRSLKELIDRESRKWVKEEDLVEYEKAIFETNGIAIRKVLEVTIPLPDTTFDYVKKQHSALFCEISIEQPFDYIKENNILVGMKPLVEYKPLDKKHPLIKDYRTQVL